MECEVSKITKTPSARLKKPPRVYLWLFHHSFHLDFFSNRFYAISFHIIITIFFYCPAAPGISSLYPWVSRNSSLSGNPLIPEKPPKDSNTTLSLYKTCWNKDMTSCLCSSVMGWYLLTPCHLNSKILLSGSHIQATVPIHHHDKSIMLLHLNDWVSLAPYSIVPLSAHLWLRY